MLFPLLEALLIISLNYSTEYLDDILMILSALMLYRSFSFYTLTFQLLIGLKKTEVTTDFLDETFIRLLVSCATAFSLYQFGWVFPALISLPFLVINTCTLITSLLVKNEVIEFVKGDDLDDEDD